MIPAEYINETYLFKRSVTEDGKYEVGIYPVMFGYRIRAGKVGQMYLNLDYCGGADPVMIRLIYNAVAQIIDDNIANGWDAFANFPKQYTKPMIKDPECLAQLLLLVPLVDLSAPVTVTEEELQGYRKKMWDDLFPVVK